MSASVNGTATPNASRLRSVFLSFHICRRDAAAPPVSRRCLLCSSAVACSVIAVSAVLSGGGTGIPVRHFGHKRVFPAADSGAARVAEQAVQVMVIRSDIIFTRALPAFRRRCFVVSKPDQLLPDFSLNAFNPNRSPQSLVSVVPDRLRQKTRFQPAELRLQAMAHCPSPDSLLTGDSGFSLCPTRMFLPDRCCR